ncbi:hypothetical protein BX600DRAFT_527540 [Xylariales sp. PMI_506]|nr:hypothetical protein BX600DRAFT_527540 [Xylariales sp. PMI_506]
MRFLSVAVGTLAIIITACQADLLQYATQLPECGLDCIEELIPVSACRTFTNDTCICTDTNLISNVSACVLSHCTIVEALTVERLEQEACNKPVRSRREALNGLFVLEGLTLICILLRFWSRYRFDRFRLDDYIMVGVLIFFVDETLYLVVLPTTKITILCFYLRIFPNQGFRRAVFVLMGWVMTTGIALIFAQIFQCRPIQYNWEGWKGTFGAHTCLDVNTLAITSAGLTIAQDVVILLLPVPLLIQLQASWRQKRAILIMFSLGIFATITSCIRLSYILQFAATTNPTWDYTDPLVWTELEVDVAIIVACLPPIRVILMQALPGVFGSTVRSASAGATAAAAGGTASPRTPRPTATSSSILSSSRGATATPATRSRRARS